MHGAPFCSLSLFRQNTVLVRRRWVEAISEHRSGSPIGRDTSFRPTVVGVRITLGAPIARVAQRQRRRLPQSRGSNPRARTMPPPPYPPPLAGEGREGGHGFKTRSVQDRGLLAAPISRALSSEEERRSYKPKGEIS